MNQLTEKTFSLLTGALAVLLILSPLSSAQEEPWKKEVGLSYDKSSGNTQKSAINVNGALMKKFDGSELSTKADLFYSATNKRMDTQKWESFTRYAWDFGPEKRWFNSYSFRADHDRFSDIDYRLTPGVGLGYHIFREDDFKWYIEDSLGYEYVKYRSGLPEKKGVVMIIHTYAEKNIFDKAKISEDLTITPSLEGEGTRIKSETAFVNPLKDGLDLSVRYIIDHDTDPAAGKKKTDTRFITGLKYAF